MSSFEASPVRRSDVRSQTALRPRPASRPADRLSPDERLDVGFAILLWFISGSPVATAVGVFETVLMLCAALFGALAFMRGFRYRARVPLFLVAAATYIIWAAVRHAFLSDASQWFPLAGHMLKLGIAALFLMASRRPLDALVRAMVWISVVAITVFGVRQAALFVAGYDIGDLFNSLYPLTGALPDRSILIFNFDIAAEVHRNSGPFREPGLYAAYLALALLFAVSPLCSLAKREKNRALVLLFVALVSTQSTMGLAVIPLILMVWLTTTARLNPMALAMIAAVVAGVALLVWMKGGQNDKLEYQMLSLQGQTGGWYTSRLGNAFVDWRAIQLKPWLGYGFAEAGRPVLWVGLLNPGFGNGLTGSIVKFGWVLGASIALLLVLGLYRLMGNFVAFALALLAFAMLLVGQQLLTLPVAFVLLGGNLGYGARRTHARRRTRLRPQVSSTDVVRGAAAFEQSQTTLQESLR